MADWRNQKYDLPDPIPRSSEGEDAKWVGTAALIVGGLVLSVALVLAALL